MAIDFSPTRRPDKPGLRQRRETGTIYKLSPCCTGPQFLTCPDPPELELPSSHSVAMTFSPARRSGESGLRQKLRPGTTWGLGLFFGQGFSGLETTGPSWEKVKP